MSTAPALQFSRELIAAFVSRGVRDVVLCPGSRSQALALAALESHERGEVAVHVRIDERSAAFTALGIGLERDAPALVVTTSGTAVAELYPAVLEAHHSGVPLIVLTADRPKELRGIGSNQTTNQVDFFGDFVRLAIDVPAPTAAAESGATETGAPETGATETGGSSTGEADANDLAQRAWSAACEGGAVALNLAFREPLS